MKKLLLILTCAASGTYATEIDVINTVDAQLFQDDFDAQYFEINHDFEKIRHILLHLVKTTGKMATYCEIKEHGKIEPDTSALVNEVLPDLLIHALQIANYYQVDLGEKYAERIQFIIDRSSKSQSATLQQPFLDQNRSE
jgi:NTP pyrophosphatase (non-canonical NTP hydrolase)